MILAKRPRSDARERSSSNNNDPRKTRFSGETLTDVPTVAQHTVSHLRRGACHHLCERCFGSTSNWWPALILGRRLDHVSCPRAGCRLRSMGGNSRKIVQRTTVPYASIGANYDYISVSTVWCALLPPTPFPPTLTLISFLFVCLFCFVLFCFVPPPLFFCSFFFNSYFIIII